MLNTLGHFVKIRSVNGLPSMPPCEDLRMIAELACERQTFLLAHRHWETFLLVKRPSAAMSEEKRLPFAGYRWIDYLVFELFITLSPFNSCFGGYVSRSRLASSTCSNEKRIANSSSSEREARGTFTSFIFSFAFGCPSHAGQKFQRLQSPFIRSSEKIVRKLEKPTLKSL